MPNSFQVTITHRTEKVFRRMVCPTPLAAVKELLQLLTPEQRMEAFGDYCKTCGDSQLPCYACRELDRE